MSKFITLAIGGLEIAGGVLALTTGVLGAFGAYLVAHGLTTYLVSAGIGTLITGLGTLLSKGPVNGFATTERNPTAPWKIVYGRARVGGTVVVPHALWRAHEAGRAGFHAGLRLRLPQAGSLATPLFALRRILLGR